MAVPPPDFAEDLRRRTAQPDDLQAVVEDGAAAPSALGADHPQTTSI